MKYLIKLSSILILCVSLSAYANESDAILIQETNEASAHLMKKDPYTSMYVVSLTVKAFFTECKKHNAKHNYDELYEKWYEANKSSITRGKFQFEKHNKETGIDSTIAQKITPGSFANVSKDKMISRCNGFVSVLESQM